MISCPFAFPVAWDSVLVNGVPSYEQTTVEGPQHWNALTGEWEVAKALKPLEGYFVKIAGDSLVVLQVPARESAADDSARSVAARAGHVADWEVGITANSGCLTDVAVAAVREGAACP